MANKKYPLTASEAEEQRTLIEWAALQVKQYPELELLYHIPNGGSRNVLEAKSLKRQGVKAGVPDLCLPVARGQYHGLYIELKAGRNKPSERQEYWLEQLEKQGYYTATCWGFRQVAEVIKEYLDE